MSNYSRVWSCWVNRRSSLREVDIHDWHPPLKMKKNSKPEPNFINRTVGHLSQHKDSVNMGLVERHGFVLSCGHDQTTQTPQSRYVPTTNTDRFAKRLARNSSHAMVAAPAQCKSSSSNSSGRGCANPSRQHASDSNNRVRLRSGSSATSVRNSGTSEATVASYSGSISSVAMSGNPERNASMIA